jgi:hypothetical protein
MLTVGPLVLQRAVLSHPHMLHCHPKIFYLPKMRILVPIYSFITIFKLLTVTLESQSAQRVTLVILAHMDRVARHHQSAKSDPHIESPHKGFCVAHNLAVYPISFFVLLLF